MAESGVLMDIRPELQQFAYASEILLGYSVNRADLREEELDLLQYYLTSIAEAFPVLSQRH